MTPILRPLTGLLLAAGVGVASAASGAIEVGAATPVDQTGASPGSFAAQYLTHGVLEDKGRPALRSYAGYRTSLGPFSLDTMLSYNSYPGARRAATGLGYDYAELSAGLRYGVWSARYNTTVSRDFFGVPDARGSSDFDPGMHRDLGHAMRVMLHAGDGRVAGSGNGAWDWRDLKAGLNRKLDSGWLLALNYTRATGAAGTCDRSSVPGVRSDGRPAFLNAGRRALVLSMARTF